MSRAASRVVPGEPCLDLRDESWMKGDDGQHRRQGSARSPGKCSRYLPKIRFRFSLGASLLLSLDPESTGLSVKTGYDKNAQLDWHKSAIVSSRPAPSLVASGAAALYLA
jgi:hypothetical protein